MKNMKEYRWAITALEFGFLMLFQCTYQKAVNIEIDEVKPPVCVVDPEFLSIALDAQQVKD